jgi:hypothetical protein
MESPEIPLSYTERIMQYLRNMPIERARPLPTAFTPTPHPIIIRPQSPQDDFLRQIKGEVTQ